MLLAAFVVYAGAGSAYSQETSFGVRVTEISDTPDPVGVGEKVTYEITVQNSGSALVEDIAIRTGTPTYGPYTSDVQLVSSELTSGSVQRSCPADEYGYIDCPVGAMGAGEEATLTLVARPMRLGEIHAGAMITVGRGPSIEPPGEVETTAVRPPAYCAVSGTEGDDSLGGPGAKGAVLCGFGGDDTFHDANGVTIYAGSGDDTVRNVHGTNTIYAGEGRDIIVPGMNRDLVYGGPGDDKIRDLWGADKLYGGPGVDVLEGGPGPDKLSDGDNVDFLDAHDSVRGNDEVYGGNGKDSISADSGDRVRD